MFVKVQTLLVSSIITNNIFQTLNQNLYIESVMNKGGKV